MTKPKEINKIKEFILDYCDNIKLGIELSFSLQKAVLYSIVGIFLPKNKYRRTGQEASSAIIKIIRKRKSDNGKKQ